MTIEKKSTKENKNTISSNASRFARLPVYILKRRLNKPELLTYIALLCFINRFGETKTTRKELSNTTGMPRRRISTSISSLLSQGLIDRTSEDRSHYHFYVMVEHNDRVSPFAQGTKGVHWGRIPVDVIQRGDLTKNEILVFALLSAHARNGSCTISRNLMTRKIGIDERSVTRATTELKKKGLIEKRGDGGNSRPCTYLLKYKSNNDSDTLKAKKRKNTSYNKEKINEIRKQYEKHQEIHLMKESYLQIMYLMNEANKQAIDADIDLDIAQDVYNSYDEMMSKEAATVMNIYRDLLEKNGFDIHEIEQIIGGFQ